MAGSGIGEWLGKEPEARGKTLVSDERSSGYGEKGRRNKLRSTQSPRSWVGWGLALCSGQAFRFPAGSGGSHSNSHLITGPSFELKQQQGVCRAPMMKAAGTSGWPHLRREKQQSRSWSVELSLDSFSHQLWVSANKLKTVTKDMMGRRLCYLYCNCPQSAFLESNFKAFYPTMKNCEWSFLSKNKCSFMRNISRLTKLCIWVPCFAGWTS